MVRYYVKLSKLQKKLHYNAMILNSKNKLETMWKIIKTETSKTNKLGVQLLKMNNNTVTDNHVMIANTLNKYLISVADSDINNVKSGNNDHENNTDHIKYLFNSISHPFPNIQWFYTSTGEIENIIKYLKTINSCGYDEIPIKVLKISEDISTFFLLHFSYCHFLSSAVNFIFTLCIFTFIYYLLLFLPLQYVPIVNHQFFIPFLGSYTFPSIFILDSIYFLVLIYSCLPFCVLSHLNGLICP